MVSTNVLFGTVRTCCVVSLLVCAPGCSYPWDEPLPGSPTTTPGGGTTDPVEPSSSGGKANGGGKTGTGTTTPGTGTQTSPLSFCESSTGVFCDDFDGPPPGMVWESVMVRSPASLKIEPIAGAPSGERVLNVATTLANNPGEASVEVNVMTSSTLKLSFVINATPSASSKSVSVLRIGGPQKDGSTSFIDFSVNPDGQITVVQFSHGVAMDTSNIGTLAPGTWMPVEYSLDGTTATLKLGSTSITRPQALTWDPPAGGSALSLGLLNVQIQGGGWEMRFDNVNVE